MTDHLLEAARGRLGGLHDHLSRREAVLAADDLHAILSAILDHLEAQQTDASIRRGLDDVAAGRTEYLGRFADDEPDPLDESNHADRYDRDGDRWVWCDRCGGFRIVGHVNHRRCHRRCGWTVLQINDLYGPLTFAPRPAEPPATAPQPDEAHGDAPGPTSPFASVNIDREAWEADMREQIAAEIEADPKSTFLAGRAETSLTSHELAIWSGMRRAARVARGEKP